MAVENLEYKKAESVAEAIELTKSGFTILSGGTWLNSGYYKGPALEKLVDISDLEIQSVTKKDDGTIRIGAGITLQELIDSKEVPGPLKKAAGFLGNRNIRNIATLGGNIAANRPDSAIIACLIAMGAVIDDTGETVESYISREGNELITSILLPNNGYRVIPVWESKSRIAYPSALGAVGISFQNPINACIAVGCAGDHILRIEKAEAVITSAAEPEKILSQLNEIEKTISENINPPGDTEGSTSFRQYMTGTVISKAVKEIVAAYIGGNK